MQRGWALLPAVSKGKVALHASGSAFFGIFIFFRIKQAQLLFFFFLERVFFLFLVKRILLDTFYFFVFAAASLGSAAAPNRYVWLHPRNLCFSSFFLRGRNRRRGEGF